MGRTTRGLSALAILVATVVGLAGSPAPPAGAAPPTSAETATTLPLGDRGTGMALDPVSGNLAATGRLGVVVRRPDHSTVADHLTLGWASAVTAHQGTFYVLLHDPAAIVAVDAATGALDGRWDLPGVVEPSGVAVVGGRVWTTSRLEADGTSLGTAMTSVDLATGAVATGTPVGDWAPMELTPAPGGTRLLGVEGPNGSGIRLFDPLDPARHVSRPSATPFPQQAAFSADGETLHVVASYLRPQYDYDPSDLARRGTVYELETFPITVAASPAADGLVAFGASNTHDPWPNVWVFRRGVPQPVLAHDLGWDRGVIARSMVFSPDGTKVHLLVWDVRDDGYAVQLVSVDLAPVVDAPSPRVLGTRGGGALDVDGAALGRGSATIGGAPAPLRWRTDTRLSLTAPALPAGPAPVVVTNGAGLSAPTPEPALVVDLGPHRDSAGWTDWLSRRFRGRASTASERTAEDARLAAGGELGALPVAAADDPAFTRHRTPLIRLYQAVFLRPPDTAGLAHWLGRMQAGQGIDSVAAAFARSAEFRTRYGALADPAFVDQVYRNVLGRAPDAPGRAHWIEQLRRGLSRGRVILLVSGSSEFRTRTATQVALTNLALGLLGRTLTGTELTAALARVAGGGSLAAEATRLVRSARHQEVVG